jgi:hypothetical protein
MYLSKALLLALVGVAAATPSGGKDDSGDGGGGGASGNGNFKVTINGKTYAASGGKTTKAKDITPTGLITVSGLHLNYVIDTKTLGVYNYTLTGYPDPERKRLVLNNVSWKGMY